MHEYNVLLVHAPSHEQWNARSIERICAGIVCLTRAAAAEGMEGVHLRKHEPLIEEAPSVLITRLIQSTAEIRRIGLGMRECGNGRRDVDRLVTKRFTWGELAESFLNRANDGGEVYRARMLRKNSHMVAVTLFDQLHKGAVRLLSVTFED